MKRDEIVFSSHAVRRMFERAIKPQDIISVIENGEIIEEYAEDQPYPSSLILGFVSGRPLHVVAATDPDRKTKYIITVYTPDSSLWENGFKRRRRK